VVPLSPDFPIQSLAGKSLHEQIRMVLAARLKDLEAESHPDADEKSRLESGIKELSP
jgi:hypothetical protein